MLAQLEKSLIAAISLDEVNQSMKNFLHAYHIQEFAFTYYAYHPKSRNKLKYDYSTSAYRRWHQYYINEHYEEVDTTLTDVYQTTLPTFWNVSQQHKEAKNKREKQLRQDALEFGITQGMCIPIHGPREDFAVLLLVQMKKQAKLIAWDKYQYDFLAAGYYYYAHIQKHLIQTQSAQNKYHLTIREHQCLTLIAQQFTPYQIGQMLIISERTVNFHIQNINKKLGTKNKHQSVNKALQKKLISL